MVERHQHFLENLNGGEQLQVLTNIKLQGLRTLFFYHPPAADVARVKGCRSSSHGFQDVDLKPLSPYIIIIPSST